MGRKNKKYSKSLHQSVYDRLKSMIAFGESKHQDMEIGITRNKIYSFGTYRTYKIQIDRYLRWLKMKFPDVNTMKAAQKHVNHYLQECTDQRKSAWTVATANAALCKLFQIDKEYNCTGSLLCNSAPGFSELI